MGSSPMRLDPKTWDDTAISCWFNRSIADLELKRVRADSSDETEEIDRNINIFRANKDAGAEERRKFFVEFVEKFMVS